MSSSVSPRSATAKARPLRLTRLSSLAHRQASLNKIAKCLRKRRTGAAVIPLSLRWH